MSQTWSTPLETYQYVTGYNTYLQSMGSDSSGALYVSGYGYDANMTMHWLVQKSVNSGSTWVVLDDYQLSPGKNAMPSAAGLFVTGNNIFVTGQATDTSGVLHSIIRQSTNAGLTWNTDNDYQYTIGQNSMGGQIASGQTGTLYVLTTGVDGAKKYHAVVRSSSDAGTTWSVVDDFMYGGDNVLSANEIAVSPQGEIFTAGSAEDADGNNHWYVRMGSSNGSTWSTVDDFVYSAGFGSAPSTTIAFDSNASVYVTGSGDDGFGSHWVVRKGEATGASWATIDDYQYQTGAGSVAGGLFEDAQSNFYVFGTGQDQTKFNEMHFNVRKSSDMGSSWTTVENYFYAAASGTGQGTSFGGFTVTPTGSVYTALSATDGGGQWHGLILSMPCVTPSPTPTATPIN